ncbi:MAG: FimB/Mfa2 family fimbrial subunit, partial [Prevotellaceae bacterium]|nr:FimB/Mfa2 family fimbrial subunit [Prevotellaceae bacterium]
MRSTLTQTSIFGVRGLLIFALAYIGLSLSSCTDNRLGREEILGSSNAKKTVLFTITVPGATQTRALQTSEENNGITETTIQTVDVLQFDHDEETFAYRALGYSIAAAGNSRTFQADLVGSGEDQTFDLIIVANARAAVEAAAAKWTMSTNMQQALDSLRITVPATAKLSTSTAVPALPMFGYVSNTPVQEGTAFVKQDGGADNSIPLIRAVAKIEVVLSTKAATGSGSVDEEYAGSDELNANFTLTDVYLYNQSLSGWVVPKIASWPTDNIATAPYFGGNATTKKADYVTGKNDPIHYTESSDNVTANSVLRSIYTFEAWAGSTAGRDTNVCLVVGGYYGNQNTTKSYYRVDFRQLNPQNEAVYLPLLRNHNYRVTVGNVTGGGYPGPDPAFHGTTANMQVNILDWTDGAQHDVVFDGVNFLSVNQAEFSLAKTTSA